MVASYGADSRAGPRHFYRVRITIERPDFHLIVMPSDGRLPSGCCVRRSGDEYYTVLTLRTLKDLRPSVPESNPYLTS